MPLRLLMRLEKVKNPSLTVWSGMFSLRRMSGLPFELLLALRYLRPKRTFVSVITLISVLGVTLGVAVLIIVISVMSGFDRQLRDKILGFNPAPPGDGTRPDHDELRSGAARCVLEPRTSKPSPLTCWAGCCSETQPQSGQSLVDAPYLRGIDPKLETEHQHFAQQHCGREIRREQPGAAGWSRTGAAIWT